MPDSSTRVWFAGAVCVMALGVMVACSGEPDPAETEQVAAPALQAKITYYAIPG